VAFSTGCVYPFVDVTGARPVDALAAGREARQLIVARDIFEHFSRRLRTPAGCSASTIPSICYGVGRRGAEGGTDSR
jgi:hypothetical protein